MFLQVCVSLQDWGGSVSQVPGPFQAGKVSLVSCPFLGGSMVSRGYRVGGGYQWVGGYTLPPRTTKAGGTHPTGMLSCLEN